MSLRKKIMLNAGSNWAKSLAVAFVGILLIPIILKSIGEKGYGIWALLATGLAYPMILDRAFGLSISRFVAYHSEDTLERNRFISASLVVLICLSLLILVASILLSFFLTDMFTAITEEYAFEATVTCILIGITLSIRVLQGSFAGALQGYQNYTSFNSVVIGGNILRLVLTFTFLKMYKSMIAVQSAFLLSMLITLITMIVIAYKLIPDLKINLKIVNKSALKQLFYFTGHSLLRSGCTIVIYSTLTLLIGWKGTAEDVTVYDIAMKLPTFALSLIAGMQNVFLPAVASLFAQKEITKIRAIAKKGTKVSLVLSFVGSILVFFFADTLLRLWLQDNPPEGAVFLMRVLILSLFPSSVFDIWLPILVAMGHLKWLSITSVLMTLISIVATVGLLVTESVSAPLAAAIGLGAAFWLRSGIWLPIYGIMKLGIRFLEYFASSLMKPIFAAACSIVLISYVAGLSFFIAVKALAACLILLLVFSFLSMHNETLEVIRYVQIKILKRGVS